MIKLLRTALTRHNPDFKNLTEIMNKQQIPTFKFNGHFCPKSILIFVLIFWYKKCYTELNLGRGGKYTK